MGIIGAVDSPSPEVTVTLLVVQIGSEIRQTQFMCTGKEASLGKVRVIVRESLRGCQSIIYN